MSSRLIRKISHIYNCASFLVSVITKMSCVHEVDNDESGGVDVGGGFLFAFYNYSQVCETTWIEKLVHVATGSDSIHVAILPVAKCIVSRGQNIKELQVEDITYTAFIGYGYRMQRASTVLNNKYKYIFLPLSHNTQYINGINFLRSLGGSKYNYWELPLTLLPKALKPSVRDEEFYPKYTPSRVFCSQVGLMLLYRCGVLPPHSEMDPSCCNPGDLVNILTENVGGVTCNRESITVVSCDNSHVFDEYYHHNDNNNNNNRGQFFHNYIHEENNIINKNNIHDDQHFTMIDLA